MMAAAYSSIQETAVTPATISKVSRSSSARAWATQQWT
jgi:hypothetical protein